MSTITRMQTAKRMSRIVIHNDTIYLCGQTSDEGSVAEQMSTILGKIDALLAEAGSDSEHILSTTIYLRDMKDFAAMNDVWDNWVHEGSAPARACVEARLARETVLVEVSVIAACK